MIKTTATIGARHLHLTLEVTQPHLTLKTKFPRRPISKILQEIRNQT